MYTIHHLHNRNTQVDNAKDLDLDFNVQFISVIAIAIQNIRMFMVIIQRWIRSRQWWQYCQFKFDDNVTDSCKVKSKITTKSSWWY